MMVVPKSTKWLWALIALACLGLAEAQVRILAPESLVKTLKETGTDFLEATTSTFGAPYYGESLTGLFVYSNIIGKCCEPSCGDDYKNAIAQMDPSLPKILAILRGGCTFTTKVKLAESFGAQAVIFIDDVPEANQASEISKFIITDDGNGAAIRIPSVMISHASFVPLRKAYETDPKTWILLQLSWTLTKKDLVTVDFWYESGMVQARKFLKEYSSHARLLRDHIRFKPRFSVFLIKDSSKSSFSLMTHLCANFSTPVCSNPPEVIGSTANGKDVVLEDLRQLCLYQVASSDGESTVFPDKWWDYVEQVPDRCSLSSNATDPASSFGEKCSNALMRELLDDKAYEEVQNCVTTKGADLMMGEANNTAWGSLALRINGVKFYGNLDPYLVSEAVCSAYISVPSFCSSKAQWPQPGAQVPNALAEVTNAGLGVATFLFYLILLIATSVLSIYVYRQCFSRYMKASLSREVMLEVRSQLQDYHRLDDTPTTYRPTLIRMQQFK